MKLKYTLGSLVLLAVFMFSVSFVNANPSFFIRQNNGTTVTATTTLLGYMTPGTATTTTISFDSMANGNPYGADSAILALQLTGSTTPSAGSTLATTTYNIAIEYSHDNIDWYSDTYSVFGTTTVAQNITTQHVRTITLGTQTLAGSLVASTTPTKTLVDVPMPTRYARAVISIPAGSTNGAVWAEFIAKKENK